MNNRQAHQTKSTASGKGWFIGCEAMGRLACDRLVAAKKARVEAVRAASEADQNSGFRLEFSDKLAAAVAKQRKVSVQSFKLALKFREKRHATHG